MSLDRRSHWDRKYLDVGAEQVSWFRADAAMSLDLLAQAGAQPDGAVLDVGGGAGVLVDELLAAGYDDVTVLDVSPAGLAVARERLGDPDAVTWVEVDLLEWTPSRRFDAWHDRAVLHFLVDDAAVERYTTLLQQGVAAGGAVVLGTFATDGPEQCSGLPVRRYSPEALAAVAGPGFRVVTTSRESHATPSGGAQAFTWVALRREAV